MRGLAIVAIVGAVGCGDPVRERSIEQLGGEDPRTPVGPLHRPGQPCLVCHGDEGPAESHFSFAGTVFQRQGSAVSLHDARVRFIDSTGAQYTVTTNCAGNFYVGASNYQPVWPVWKSRSADHEDGGAGHDQRQRQHARRGPALRGL